jgi:hypothetical protein
LHLKNNNGIGIVGNEYTFLHERLKKLLNCPDPMLGMLLLFSKVEVSMYRNALPLPQFENLGSHGNNS